MANIRKRGSKWQVQIRRTGQPSRTKTFIRKEEALAWGRSQEVHLDTTAAGVFIPSKDYLSDLLSRYAAEVTAKKKSAASETRRISRLLRDPISKKRVCDLTPELFAKFRNRRLNDGKRAAAYDLQIIRHMLNIASAEWGVQLPMNPLDKARFPAPSRPRQRRLVEGEYDALITNAKESGSLYLAPVIILAVETGMRAGEMLKLRWCDWNADAKVLRLLDTKNGQDRLVPLTQTATALLETLPFRGERIFETNYEALKSAWQRLLKKAGISDLRFHDLRHEATSRFFEMGLTVPEVASITGHKTPTMLLRYAHADIVKVQRKLEVTSNDSAHQQRF
jgi:integrase